MDAYLIEFNGNLQVVSTNNPRVLNNVIGKIPSNIDSEDFPYLAHRLVPDENIPELVITEIYLDESLKTAKMFEDSLAEIELKWQDIEEKRNRLLSESDYTQLPDVPHTTQEKADWAVYRQALRDIDPSTRNSRNPDNIVFPTKP